MKIITLDVRGTHVSNPDCPSRLAQDPSGGWYCIDCGLHILHKVLTGCFIEPGIVTLDDVAMKPEEKDPLPPNSIEVLFRRLVNVYRSWCELDKAAGSGNYQFVQMLRDSGIPDESVPIILEMAGIEIPKEPYPGRGWWPCEGKWASPLADPDCPFPLESDETPK